MNPRLRSMPLLALAICGLLAFGVTACGSSSDAEQSSPAAPSADDFPSPAGKSIVDLFNAQKASDLVAAPAASVFEVGKNRYPLGIFDVGGAAIDDAEVALYFAKSPQSPVEGPLPAKRESMETKPAFQSKGSQVPGESKFFYVADDVKFNRSGPWLAVALFKTDDGFEASRLAMSPNVGQSPDVAAVGDKAPVVNTPTAESVGGDLSKIDTRQPPDDMHDVDFKNVVGKKPVALQFATPALCQTKICGPVVDIAEQVKTEIGDGVDFIHQEIYNENDPNKGLRPQLGPYGLKTEPWMFLIGSNGKIQQRIEGPFSVDELTADIEKLKASG